MPVSIQLFSYNKGTNNLTGELSTIASYLGTDKYRWPEFVEVSSPTTGNIVKFVQDHEAAMEAEFWDGAMYKYTTDDYRVPGMSLWLLND